MVRISAEETFRGKHNIYYGVFKLVDEILEIASAQSDVYAKSSCLALAYDLSLKSGTTELSNFRQTLLLNLKSTAEESIKIELNHLLKYYRLELAT